MLPNSRLIVGIVILHIKIFLISWFLIILMINSGKRLCYNEVVHRLAQVWECQTRAGTPAAKKEPVD